MKYVLAIGGGVDSTALALIDANRPKAARFLGISIEEINQALPVMDAWVFSDPGAEKGATYENIERLRALADKWGIDFHTIKKGDYKGTGRAEPIPDWLYRLGIVPVMPGGSHVCSLKYKAEVMHSWAAYTFPNECIKWFIGIEANEQRRCKKFTEKANSINLYAHPLVVLGLTRAKCEALISFFGWPPVAKSSCVFCPYMSAEELEDMFYNAPADWQQGEEIELRFKEVSPERHAAWLAAGSPTDSAGRAPRGMWRLDSFNEGARLYQAKLNGKKATVQEWRAHFEAKAKAEAAA